MGNKDDFMTTILYQGATCSLVTMQEIYLPTYTRYLNDPEVNRYLRTRPPYSLEGQRRWLRAAKKKNDQVLAILVGNLFVGVMELRYDDKRQSAESAAVIGNKNYWGMGIAYEARLWQLNYAFTCDFIDYVWSTTIRANIRSRKFLERVGYNVVKINPNAREINGVLHDEIIYAITRSEWFLWDAMR